MSTRTLHLRQTRAYAGVFLHRLFVSPISYVVYMMALLPLAHTAFYKNDYTTLSLVTGLLLFALHVEALFIQQELEDDIEPVLDANNLGCYLTFDYLRRLKKLSKPTVKDLCLAATKTKRASFMLHMLGLNGKEFRKRYGDQIPTMSADEFLASALENAKKLQQDRITGPIALLTLIQQGGAFDTLLQAADVSEKDVKDIVQWEMFRQEMTQQEGLLSPTRLIHSLGSIGRSWVQGYTNELDQISEEISGRVVWRTKQRGIMLHQNELDSAVHILSRSGQKNMLVIGPEGTGKTSMLENISTLLRREELKKGRPLTRILVLRTETLLSGGGTPDRLLLRALEKAEKSGKFIVIIENMPLFLTAADPNTLTVLSKFLQSKSISVFAVSSPNEYHKYIKGNSAFDSMFEKIYVNDTEDKDTIAALMVHYFHLQKKLGSTVHVTHRALNSIMKLTKRYVGTGGMPGKVIDVLEDAYLTAKNEGKLYITEDHVRKAISLKAHMDVEQVSDDEKDRLLELEDALRVDIIGQEKAVSSLVNSLKRARLDINAGKRPLGTFLFLGPTGVGKTHTAKVLAEKYFGSTDALLRIDMNEYGTEESVYGLIGDPNPTVETATYLSKQVQDKPFSLILLDEIEKAHPKVLNVFLQILDEGHLTDNRGGTTDFKNTIIIATSNAGALFIRDFVKEHGHEKQDTFKQSLIDEILKQRIFSPEFINRFDDVILYYPMTIKEAIKVAMIMLDDIVQEIAEAKGYKIRLDVDVVAEIVKHGYSIEFGAREMRRVIVDVIENFLADYLLSHTVKRGDEIHISLQEVQSYS